MSESTAVQERDPTAATLASPRGTPRAWRGELGWLAATMAAALVAACYALRLWSSYLHVPFAVQGDVNFTLVVAKDLIEPGWYLGNDNLAAPSGQELYDFAAFAGDSLHMVSLKLLGLFSDDVAAVTNAYYVLTFPLTAGAAYVALRAVRASRPSSALCGLLFATLPYHFLRGEQHLFFSGYFAVPVAAFLVLSVMVGPPLLRRRAGPGRGPAWLSARTALTLACCLVVVGGSAYYATFALMLLVFATILTALQRDRARVAQGVLVTGVLLSMLALMLSPNILYRLAEGANPVVGKRIPQESEIYSFTLTQLVLPIPGHRAGVLADLAERYASTTVVPGEGSAHLGALATVGLLTGLALVLTGLGLTRRRRWSLTGAASVMAVLTVLVGTTGGFSALASYILTPQIRGWNRISVFTAFFSLVILALLLDAVRKRLGESRVRNAGWLVGVAVLAVAGVLDQTTSAFAPDYAAARREWSNDARFVGEIDRRLPPRAMVFQLPYMPFPESLPVGGVADYDLARGYLHSADLRWSYGAMKGRPEDFSEELSQQPTPRLLMSVAASGFQGLWIDRAGYADRGAGLEQAVGETTTATALASENGRLSFFDLRGYAARLRARYPSSALAAVRRAALQPVERWGTGFYAPEGTGTSMWRWMASVGTLALKNTGPDHRAVVIEADVRTNGPAQLVVALADGRIVRLRTSSKPTPLRLRLVLPPGESHVQMSTDAAPTPTAPGDPRDLRLQVLNPLVTDAAAAGPLRSA